MIIQVLYILTCFFVAVFAGAYMWQARNCFWGIGTFVLTFTVCVCVLELMGRLIILLIKLLKPSDQDQRTGQGDRTR